MHVWLAGPLRGPQSRSWVARTSFSQRLSPVGGLGRSVARVGAHGCFVARVGVPGGAMRTAAESDEAHERRESVSRTAEPSHDRIRPVAPEKSNRAPLRSSRALGNMTGEEARGPDSRARRDAIAPNERKQLSESLALQLTASGR
jgi:hypothetical protein